MRDNRPSYLSIGQATALTRRQGLTALAAAALSALVVPAYAQTEDIVLGQTIALTGPLADLGRAMSTGSKVYFDALNVKGGIKGRQVKLITLDDGYDVKRSQENIKTLMLEKGFTGFFGCVLHHLALKEGRHFVDTKPDVCWQLPLRRSFETREVGEREYSVTVIGEYERLAWGDGGDEFDWYCTSNTEAHVGVEPVYISNKTELIALIGVDSYYILAMHCDQRIAAIKEIDSRKLPLFVIQHPASAARN